MMDISKLKNLAASLLADATDEASLTRATDLVKAVEEIENQRASTLKLIAEQKSLQHGLTDSRHQHWKSLLTILTPLVTTVVLAGTLALQSYEFRKSESDKISESQHQEDLAERARWTDTLKLLSQSEKLSPAAALLRSFTTYPYKDYARDTAIALLSQRKSEPAYFEELCRSTLEPADWKALPNIIQLDRSLFSEENPLLLKEYDEKTKKTDSRKLTKLENRELDYLSADIKVTNSLILPLLKSARPPGIIPDLRSVDLSNADLNQADLSGANIEGSDFAGAQLEGTNLGGITNFGSCVFSSSLWWHAAKISPELLEYLKMNFAYDDAQKQFYPNSARPVSKNEYESELVRLRAQHSK